MLSVMARSWCRGLVVLSENITLRMNFWVFLRVLATDLFAFWMEDWAIRGLSVERGCIH